MTSPVISLVPVPGPSPKMSRSKEELAAVFRNIDGVSPQSVPTTVPWIEAIRERWRFLKGTHGVNQYDLEAWLDASQASLSALLGQSKRGIPTESPHVERLSIALDVEVPLAVRTLLVIREAANRGAPDDLMHGVMVMARDALDRLDTKK